jgi:hypothetical protein
MIFDHLALHVSDFAKARGFFIEALMPLQIRIVKEGEGWAGFGRDGRMQFVIAEGEAQKPLHVAFAATTREDVRQFHQAALSSGGHDNGAPGIRAHYGPTYFGAFVIGPDGHNTEAVTRTPGD